MKLYNLFNQVILEEINKQTRLLTEGVGSSEIIAAIDGKYNVKITYRDPDTNVPSKRYIQIYQYGTTTAGNDAVRAYQIDGGSKTSPNGWKLFRIDRIDSFGATGMKWYNPISDYDPSIPSYNQTGDETLASVKHMVNVGSFTRQRSDINQNPNNNELNK